MENHVVELRARARLAWVKRYQETGNISQVCREFSISRRTFYKWWPCYAHEGLAGLKDHSKRPKNHPRALPVEIQELILELHRKTGYVSRRLVLCLERDYEVTVSTYGVYRVLVRAGQIEPEKAKLHRNQACYQTNYPGQTVRVYTKYMPVMFDTSHPEGYRQYQYTATDDCTRLGLVKTYDELCPSNSVDFAQRMLRFFPFSVEEVQTGHGTEFTYIFMPHVKKPHAFEQFLKEKGIRHKLIPMVIRRQNGKLGRSHRTDSKEFYDQGQFRKGKNRNNELVRYRDYCDNRPSDRGLGWTIPWAELRCFGISPNSSMLPLPENFTDSGQGSGSRHYSRCTGQMFSLSQRAEAISPASCRSSDN